MSSGWKVIQELVRTEMRKVCSETVVEYATTPRNVGSKKDYLAFKNES